MWCFSIVYLISGGSWRTILSWRALSGAEVRKWKTTHNSNISDSTVFVFFSISSLRSECKLEQMGLSLSSKHQPLSTLLPHWFIINESARFVFPCLCKYMCVCSSGSAHLLSRFSSGTSLSSSSTRSLLENTQILMKWTVNKKLLFWRVFIIQVWLIF